MKKLLTTFMLLLTFCTAAMAGTVEIDGINYNLNDDGTAEVTNACGGGTDCSEKYSGNVTIPSSVTYDIKTYSVTSIGEDAFRACTGLTSIEIPNSVTSIGLHAFNDCSGLTSITIPNSVTSIGTRGGNYAFNGCTGLTSITVEAGNTKYDSRNNCNAIIETAKNTLIVGCQTTVIPNNVTRIGLYAFNGCSSLTSITIPNSVTRIEHSAFNGCTGLTSITIPNSVTSIDYYAFENCSGLTSIEIPNSVTSIGKWVFYGCTGLTSITIPNSVTSIEDGAFHSCKGLTSITIPESVTSIGDGAFTGCMSLTSITVEQNNTVYDSRDNCNAIIKTATNTLILGCQNTIIPNSVTSIGEKAFSGCESLTSIEIPNSVTSIGQSAFYRCTGLTSITIPESVTSIGEKVFSGCTGLTSITIPESVTSINFGAFSGCNGLTSITCKATTPPTLDDKVFNNVPKSIPLYVPAQSVEAYKAADQWKKFNVLPLVSLYYHNTDTSEKFAVWYWRTGESGTWSDWMTAVPEHENWYQVSIPSDCENVIFSEFPKATSEPDWDERDVQTHDLVYDGINAYWVAAADVEDGSYMGIDSEGNYYTYYFRTGSWQSSFDLPTVCTESGSCGDNLQWCYNSSTGNLAITGTGAMTNWSYISVAPWDSYRSEITSINLPDGLTSIGDSAFSDCTSLTSIEIPNSVTSIGEVAFGNCSDLTSITIPNNVTSIGLAAFGNCSGLTNVTIPNSVTSIGKYAFFGCEGLTSMTIPESVLNIGDSAFIGCKSLMSVDIINSEVSIGAGSFRECVSLESVNLGNGVKSIGNFAFAYCGMTSIIIPNSVTSIGDGAFYNCWGLMSVVIGSGNSDTSNMSVGYGAFRGCSGLTNVTIGNSVTTIGDYAFQFCRGLTSVTIPNSVTSIGSGTFAGCNGLTNIKVEAGNTKYDSRDNCNAIIETATNTLIAGCQSTVIPNSVKSIGEAAFWYCTGLTSVTIPNSVTSIGEWAFYGCTGLTNIICKATTPPSLGDAVFYDVNKSIPLYVPAESVDAYKAAYQWKDFNVLPLDNWDPEHPTDPSKFMLELTAEPEDLGTVVNGGLHPQKHEVTFSAVPNEGSRFIGWSDGAPDATRTIMLVCDTAFTAYFEPDEYTVTFVNHDNTVLQQSLVKTGDMPEYTGPTPVRESNEGFAFTFAGWEPEIVPVVASATYTAVYDSIAFPDTVYISDRKDLAQMFVGPVTHVIATETADISITSPVTVKSLTLRMTDGSAPSVDNLENLTADVIDMVLRLEPDKDEAVPSKWYVFGVPFEVPLSTNFRAEGSDAPAVMFSHYVIDEYDGALCAAKSNGWKRVEADATLLPGHAYMIAVNGTGNLWRLTKQGGSPVSDSDAVSVTYHASYIGAHHAGWNGIANPRWTSAYASMPGLEYATIYHNAFSVYETLPLDESVFSNSCPLFVQTAEDGTVNFSAADNGGRLPIRRGMGNQYGDVRLTLSLTDNGIPYTDKAYLTLSPDADGSQYTIGGDLEKMMTANASVPQLWITAYGTSLAAHVMPPLATMTLPIGLYAPEQGDYTFDVSGIPSGMEILLTQDGSTVWNLTLGDCQLQLDKGDNSGYALVIKLPGGTVTGLDEVHDADGDQTVKYIEHGVIYIRHRGITYDTQGKKTAK